METLRAHEIKTTFFNTETLNAMCRKLITHYFLLTQQDLQLWDSDPESFGKYREIVDLSVTEFQV